jgi:hypothetical protein
MAVWQGKAIAGKRSQEFQRNKEKNGTAKTAGKNKNK